MKSDEELGQLTVRELRAELTRLLVVLSNAQSGQTNSKAESPPLPARLVTEFQEKISLVIEKEDLVIIAQQLHQRIREHRQQHRAATGQGPSPTFDSITHSLSRPFFLGIAQQSWSGKRIASSPNWSDGSEIDRSTR